MIDRYSKMSDDPSGLRKREEDHARLLKSRGAGFAAQVRQRNNKFSNNIMSVEGQMTRGKDRYLGEVAKGFKYKRINYRRPR